MSYFAQLPPDHILNRSPNPMALWDSEELVKTYLKSSLPIFAPDDRAPIQARLKKLQFDRDLALMLLERKLLRWSEFPIRDLPDDILTIIFRFVVWSSADAAEGSKHRLYLTWICKRFRALALSDATLWSWVWIRDAAPWERSFTYIQRAGMAPLDIRIDEKCGPKGDAHDNPPKYPRMTVPQIKNLLEVLKPQVGQLRTLIVVLANIEVVEAFMEGLSKAGPLTSLERIEVNRTGSPHLWPKEKCAGAGGHLALSAHPIPKLRELSLWGVTTNWNALPPSNLRTLTLRRIAPEGCPTSDRWMEILRASPGLLKLSLDAAGPQRDTKNLDIRSARLPYLPSLRELTIENMSCVQAAHVLAHMHAPHVMHLSLMLSAREDSGQLVGLLAGRFPEVRMLHLQGLQVAKTDLNTVRTVRWFDSMPHLKMFKFSLTSSHILNALLADPRDYHAQGTGPADGEEAKRPAICPELDTVLFDKQGEKDVSTLAKGRKDLGVVLKRVYTSDDTGSKRQERMRIRESVGQVLRVAEDNLQKMTPEEAAVYDEMSESVGIVFKW
ncbi:hypothetical protein VTO73DRAFT_12826 [Trametes versicolor]